MAELQLGFKVILLGNCAVGKSQLILRYTSNVFNGDSQSTIGMSYRTKTVRRQRAQLRISLWDCGGHEQFRALTTSFYRQSDGAVVVFDIHDLRSFEDVPMHIQELRRIVPECPVFVCCNKCDLLPSSEAHPDNAEKEPLQELVDLEKARQLAASLGCGFYQTSALTGENVAEMFDALSDLMIARELDNQDAKEEMQTIEVVHAPNADAQRSSWCC